MTKPLDAREEELAALLARAGLSARPARVFAALARGRALTATELAEAGAMSRQEAGDAARELELAGLVRVEKVSTGGRPAHRYHLAREGLAPFLEARRAQLRAELAALDALSARSP